MHIPQRDTLGYELLFLLKKCFRETPYWRLPGQLCALFKPVSSTNQGRISDVLAVSKHPKGMREEFLGIWGLRLRSSPAIFTDQGQIIRVFPVSECMYGIVGSSFEEKKLNENNCTKIRSRGWGRRWRSLGNPEKFIIIVCHYNQRGGWTNKQILTSHKHCWQIEHHQRNQWISSGKIQFLYFFDWLVKMCWHPIQVVFSYASSSTLYPC